MNIKESESLREFLELNGYRSWKKETDSAGSYSGTIEHFQKRMDNKEGFAYSLCLCNDKVFLNIQHHKYSIQDKEYESCQISLVHENQDGDWADIKIYSLSPEKLSANLEKYELKLLNMWEVFCDN